MTTTTEIARRLRKSVNGADVMTLTDFQRFMGYGKNGGKDKLAGIPKFCGKFYMIEDIAKVLYANMEE